MSTHDASYREVRVRLPNQQTREEAVAARHDPVAVIDRSKGNPIDYVPARDGAPYDSPVNRAVRDILGDRPEPANDTMLDAFTQGKDSGRHFIDHEQEQEKMGFPRMTTFEEITRSALNRQPQSGHPRYYALLEELKQLHHDKNRAYGTQADPFANFTSGEAYGLSKVDMIKGRLADKIARFQNDAKRDFALVPGMGQDNETPEQTYRDLASLFLILIITLEERRAAAQ